jgi:hypothetical protein
MKDAIIVLLVVINAALVVLVYYQDPSDAPAPYYGIQAELSHDAPTGNDVQIWCESERLTAQAYTARIWGKTSPTDFTFGTQTESVEAAARKEESLARRCEPAELTVRQVTDAYCTFLQENPEKRSAPATLLFSEAVTRAWPCRPR